MFIFYISFYSVLLFISLKYGNGNPEFYLEKWPKDEYYIALQLFGSSLFLYGSLITLILSPFIWVLSKYLIRKFIQLGNYFNKRIKKEKTIPSTIIIDKTN
jgi:hypothetical protein